MAQARNRYAFSATDGNRVASGEENIKASPAKSTNEPMQPTRSRQGNGLDRRCRKNHMPKYSGNPSAKIDRAETAPGMYSGKSLSKFQMDWKNVMVGKKS